MKKTSWTTAILMALAVLAATAPLSPTRAVAKLTPEQYWAETEMNFEELKGFYTQCQKNEQNFLACLQSLNTVAGALKVPAVFILPGEMMSPIAGKAIIPSSPLALVEKLNPPSTVTRMEYWNMVRRVREMQASAAKETYAAYGQRKQIDFSRLVDALQGMLVNDGLAGKEAMLAGQAINTYLASAVDPHTYFKPIRELQDQFASSDESFVGVGIMLATQGSVCQIAGVFENGPAHLAGIQVGDVILQIDGETADCSTAERSINRIRGLEGSSVRMSIQRGESTLDVVIVRMKVVNPNVSSKILKTSGRPVGYIRLSSFADERACTQVKAAILSVEKQGAQGIIFDVRGNGGGLLNEAVCIGGLFFGKKVVVGVKNLTGNGSSSYSGPEDAITHLPMVTLIDSGSASASELIAGALQDHQRSWIAGDRSFGKGTVQAPFQASKTLVIYRTIQRFYQPSGRTNQVVGIMPDFAIDSKPNATDEDRFAMREADYYTNSLPSIGPIWSQPRPDDVKKIESCVKAASLADKLYGRPGVDYRLVAAEEILRCSAAQ